MLAIAVISGGDHAANSGGHGGPIDFHFRRLPISTGCSYFHCSMCIFPAYAYMHAFSCQDANLLHQILLTLRDSPYVQMDLSNNALGHTSGRDLLLQSLRELLKQDYIAKLQLSDNGLSDGLLAQLGPTLETCSSLLTLNISNNAVGPLAAAAIGKVLENNRSITMLWMNWNMVDGLAGAEIIQGCVYFGDVTVFDRHTRIRTLHMVIHMNTQTTLRGL